MPDPAGEAGPPAFGIDGLVDPVEIGRGGMGVVYRVRQPALRRSLALKVLLPGVDAAGASRLAREAAALGGLTGHPHVVPVIATGVTSAGMPYLLMPFFPGRSLADRLHEQGKLPVDDVLHIGIALAGALSVAHGAGIVHRDVKPENVLVSEYGEPMIADFGISRMADAYQTTGAMISATLAHAAPEVLDGRPPSAAADIYALASTLFALLAGAPPFPPREDEALVALYVRIAREPVPDLRAAGVPDALCAVLESALSKDPVDRPPSMADFGRRLQAVERSRGLAPTPMVGVPALRSDEPSARGAREPVPGFVAAAPTPAIVPASPAGDRQGAPAQLGPALGRRSRIAVGAVVAAVVLLGALAGFALTRDDGGDEAARPPAGAVTAADASGTSRPVAESSVAESSVAESSVAESSVAESSVAESSVPESSVVPESVVPESVVPESVVPESTAAAPPAAQSGRARPIPFGTPIEVGPDASRWRVSLGFPQDETASIAAADGRNLPPASGSVYLGVHMELTYLGPEASSMVREGVDLVAYTDRAGPFERAIAGVPSDLDCWVNETVARGDTKQCYLPFEVPASDVGSLLLKVRGSDVWLVAHH